MSGGRTTAADDPSALDDGASAWEGEGQVAPLRRWMERALDPEGIPRSLPVQHWTGALARLAEARRQRPGWPALLDARIEGWFRETLRFCRPDGSAVFGPGGSPEGIKELFRYWADQLSDPGLRTVVDWWFPVRSKREAPPPLPASARSDRPLASLRASWSASGDFLAVDHRRSGATSEVELYGLGRPWLGARWTAGAEGASATKAQPKLWISNPSADLAEWAFRVGDVRVLRTALLLRGRRLGLLADQLEGPSPAAMRIELAEDVETAAIAEHCGMRLVPNGGRSSARVFPLSMPCRPLAPERGSFTTEGRELVLRHRDDGIRRWLPLLVSWEPLRDRKQVSWRLLTVAEKSKICPPEAAFAVRITWGRDDTLVIYRSLARPTLRSFLGHQTRARFLVGLFDKEGKVVPILNVEE